MLPPSYQAHLVGSGPVPSIYSVRLVNVDFRPA